MSNTTYARTCHATAEHGTHYYLRKRLACITFGTRFVSHVAHIGTREGRGRSHGKGASFIQA